MALYFNFVTFLMHVEHLCRGRISLRFRLRLHQIYAAPAPHQGMISHYIVELFLSNKNFSKTGIGNWLVGQASLFKLFPFLVIVQHNVFC
jgi:hypothetical protein